jgi:tetratricopeptide (TPR) repeat protein
MGWFWFLGTLVPVIGLVQVGIQSLADRYTYVPLIGTFIAVVWGGAMLVNLLPASRIVGASASATILLACIAPTRFQIHHWRNSETLFRHSIAIHPQDPLAQYSLGFYLFEKGRAEEAIEHYRVALRSNPTSVELLSDLGAALDQTGHGSEAMEKLTQAVQFAPRNALVQYRLANVMNKSGQRPQAVEHYRAAIELEPEFIEARSNLAVALFRENRMEEAIEQFRAIVRVQHTSAGARFNLARALTGAGRRDEAKTNLLEALQLDPNFAPARQFLNSLNSAR